MALKTSTAAAAAAGLGAAAGLLIAVQVQAGGDLVKFPENYDKGVLYSTVDRFDNKQYRELWSTPEGVEAARKGEPVPSGTVLTLVQYKAQVPRAIRPRTPMAASRRAISSPTR